MNRSWPRLKRGKSSPFRGWKPPACRCLCSNVMVTTNDVPFVRSSPAVNIHYFDVNRFIEALLLNIEALYEF